MPIRVPWVPQTIDAPAVASKLPEPLQWAGGAALEGLKQLTGIGTGDPNSVMQVGAPLMAAESEGAGMGALKGLYSRVQRVAESLPDWVHPAKALSTLKNLASKEEMDFRGVGDFLGERQGPQKMPKADLLQHLVENPAPDVRVKTLQSGPYAQTGPVSQQVQYNRPDLNVPGGKNYTESLFQLNRQEPPVDPAELKDWYYKKYGGSPRFVEPENQPADWFTNRFKEDLPDSYAQFLQDRKNVPVPYQSSHWNDPNVLVHTREDVRPDETGALGRFLQEVQSDWHQQGKERGYVGQPLKYASPDDPVPDAPFKDTWPDLALKKHVMDVVNSPDQQWLGFTTGQTQADRYNLSRRIGMVDYDPVRKELAFTQPDGSLGGSVTAEPHEIANWIGRENAAKLLAQPPDPGTGTHLLQGLDFTMGGEGMKSFYDQLLPKRLEKILKPFGGSVEQGAVQTSTPTVIVKPTQIPRSQLPNLPLSEERPWTSEVRVGGQHIASAWPPVPSGPGAVPAIRGIALDLADLISSKISPNTTPAWLARFTPEMKAAIKEKGLPLLSLLGLMKAVPSHSQQDSQ